MNNYLLILICFVLFGFSCGKEEEEPPLTCDEKFAIAEQKALLINDAILAYGENQTSENCKAYLAAVKGYVDAATPLLECPNLTAEEKANIQTSIDAANATLVTIPC